MWHSNFIINNYPIILHIKQLWMRVKWIVYDSIIKALSEVFVSSKDDVHARWSRIMILIKRMSNQTHHGLLDLVVYGHHTGSWGTEEKKKHSYSFIHSRFWWCCITSALKDGAEDKDEDSRQSKLKGSIRWEVFQCSLSFIRLQQRSRGSWISRVYLFSRLTGDELSAPRTDDRNEMEKLLSWQTPTSIATV